MQKQTKTQLTFTITDATSGEVLAENVLPSAYMALCEDYSNKGYKLAITETAAAGSTSAGSIAVNMSSGSKPYSIKSFMDSFNKRVVNKFKPKPYTITVTEAFDFGDVLSRLSSMEKTGQTARTKGTTFGIEDDQKNIMKVTVRADQAEEFEKAVAAYLADIKTSIDYTPRAKDSKEVSMAELLYKMKDKFDIIDVEFPDIPTDVIYNAEKASVGLNAGEDADNIVDINDEFGGEAGGELGDELGDGTGDEFGGEAGGELGDELTGDLDADMATDVAGEDESLGGEESMLNQVIAMLKAQADAQAETAKAEGEKAKAEQARYSAQAANAAIAGQEDKLRYEAEMELNSKREKEAKEKADMAKYNISKTLNMASGMNESSEGDTPALVQRERASLNQRYAPAPDDTPDLLAYKSKQKAEAIKELNARYAQAVNRMNFERRRKIKQQELDNQNKKATAQPNQQQPNQQPNQQQNAQQPNAQQPNGQQQSNQIGNGVR